MRNFITSKLCSKEPNCTFEATIRPQCREDRAAPERLALYAPVSEAESWSRLLSSEKGTGRMKVDDALRKIRLMRRITLENGCTPSETENAMRLTQALTSQFSVDEADVRPIVAPSHRLTWVYWQHLLNEFGFELRCFGKRASASLSNAQHVLVVKLDSGKWHVQRMTPRGWETELHGVGLDSLRKYLGKKAPRSYSLASH
jgi:hypothetical protein